MSRLLIVDDDVRVTNPLLVLFIQTGRYEVEILNDSTLVLPLLARARFDALLLDMDMPSLSGVDILRHLREAGDYTPVVVLTGVGDAEPAVQAMKLGAFDYLIKPADEDALVAVIDAAVASRTRRNGAA
ncbi:MAG: response regulator [Pseudomonadota bacterium]